MEYEEVVEYILKECEDLDLNLIDREHLVAEIEKAAN